MSESYAIEVFIFILGIFTTICTTGYILHGSRKYKNVDPLEEENSK